MKEELDEFKLPREVTDAIGALDNNTRRKIMEYLMQNEKLYYSDIGKKLGLLDSKEQLEDHLMILSKSGLVDRYTSRLDYKSDEKSYYKLSPFAIKLINGILLSLEPSQNMTSILSEQEPIIKEDSNSLKKSKRTHIVKKVKTKSGWEEKLAEYYDYFLGFPPLDNNNPEIAVYLPLFNKNKSAPH